MHGHGGSVCTGMPARFRLAVRLLHASVDTFVESSCAWTKVVGEAKGDEDGDIALPAQRHRETERSSADCTIDAVGEMAW